MIHKVVAGITDVYKLVSMSTGRNSSLLKNDVRFHQAGEGECDDGYITGLLQHFEVRGKAKTPAITDVFTVSEDAQTRSER